MWQNIYKSAPSVAKCAAWDCGCYVSMQTLMASKAFPLSGTHQHTCTTCKIVLWHPCPSMEHPGARHCLLGPTAGATSCRTWWWWVATCLQGKHVVLTHHCSQLLFSVCFLSVMSVLMFPDNFTFLFLVRTQGKAPLTHTPAL